MNSFVLILICLAAAVLLQYLICRSDSLFMGLVIPAVFVIVAIVVSTTTMGNSMNKTMAFIEWLIPAIAALFIYVIAKKQKHDRKKKKAKKEAEKLLRQQEQLGEPEEAEVEAIEDADIKQLK